MPDLLIVRRLRICNLLPGFRFIHCPVIYKVRILDGNQMQVESIRIETPLYVVHFILAGIATGISKPGYLVNELHVCLTNEIPTWSLIIKLSFAILERPGKHADPIVYTRLGNPHSQDIFSRQLDLPGSVRRQTCGPDFGAGSRLACLCSRCRLSFCLEFTNI